MRAGQVFSNRLVLSIAILAVKAPMLDVIRTFDVRSWTKLPGGTQAFKNDTLAAMMMWYHTHSMQRTTITFTCDSDDDYADQDHDDNNDIGGNGFVLAALDLMTNSYLDCLHPSALSICQTRCMADIAQSAPRIIASADGKMYADLTNADAAAVTCVR